MLYSVRKFLIICTQSFDSIDSERKEILKSWADYMQAKYHADQPILLNFICTHNSRRSHFGQIGAALAASYYAIDNVHTFSGGTVATKMNENAIIALKRTGLIIQSDGNTNNPIYTIQFGINNLLTCFSKEYTHPINPKKEFAAIMTCTDADEACPSVLGAEKRFSLPYQDPKKSDGTGKEDIVYHQRLQQICTEVLYTFSLIK